MKLYIPKNTLDKIDLESMERHIKHHPKDNKLPYVLPIVYLYTGVSEYKVSHCFFDIFYNPEFARKLLTGEFKVVELNKISD